VIVFVSKGDISKYDYIKWRVPISRIEKYKKYLVRELLFREAILAFLGVKDSGDSKSELKTKLCKYCQDKNCKDCKIEEFNIG